MREATKLFFENEDGATAIEYGLIAALIAVAIISAVGALAGNLGNSFNTIATEVDKAFE